MPKFEQLQARKSRSREESVPSTFPDEYKMVHGDPGDDVEDILDKITEVIATHEHLHDEARHHLGHLGITAS